jgi:hypothetical protein
MVGILKNAPELKVPKDFFDLGNDAAVQETNQLQKTEMEDEDVVGNKDSELPHQPTKTVPSCQEEALPEGFFDDPLQDAKASQVYSFKPTATRNKPSGCALTLSVKLPAT